jgi:pyruvate dehydrogenase E1 component
MFGFQRAGDLLWAAADMGTRGFLLGGTAGRTTLAGEGLQHQDGHSHLLAATIPNCRAYDPAFGYEVAVILHEGLRHMYGPGEDANAGTGAECFYYLTLANENHRQPAMPPGQPEVYEGIRRGMYLLREGQGAGPRVQLLGSGSILWEVMAAADLLWADFGVAADVYSVTSFTELRREGLTLARAGLLHPEAPARKGHAETLLGARTGPVVAATDYMKAYADQIREFVPHRYRVLGTDGFGRSDTREKLREFFEVSRCFVVVAALKSLAEEGLVPVARITEAIRKYGIDADRGDPAIC